MVGRSEILENLQERLTLAGDGRGQAIALVGDAGVGKSRLVHEVLSSAAASGWVIWQLEAQPLDRRTPFSVARLLVRRWLGNAGDGRQATLDVALSERLRADGLDEPRTATPLRALLDLPIAHEDWADLAQVQRRSRIVSAIAAIIRRACRSSPLLLIIEDAHWCDDESWQALQSLLPALSDTRMGIVLTRRPDSEKRLPEQPHCAEVHLRELDTNAAERMLSALLGNDLSLAGVKTAILRAGRIPLYIEEIVNHLSRRGVIEGERGQFKAVRPATDIDLPRSVQTIAASRLDALHARPRSMVLAASIIGRRIDPKLLASIVGKSEEEVADVLRELVIAGIFEDPGSSKPQL